MIAIVVGGLAALVVLALVVGLFEAAQAEQWRAIARDRRAAWEHRQENLALTRRRFLDH